MTMKKVVFCNIAWMKNYCGITEDDKPYNGGLFVDETGTAYECYNFQPNNHYCYGYFMSSGNRLNLSRVEGKKVSDSVSAISGVTVVWVANRTIVGWYENATMYRVWTTFYDETFGEDDYHTEWLYNFKVDENDVYLIPNDIRNFEVPSAPRAGSGRGMGQSNIWYADSDYARKVFVPQVLVYLDEVRDECIQNIITPEQFNKRSTLNLSDDKLMERAKAHILDTNYLGALQIYNLVKSRAVKPQNACYLTFLRGHMLQKLLLHDEALEDYKRFNYDFAQLSDKEKSIKAFDEFDLHEVHSKNIFGMASIYMTNSDNYFLAIENFRKFIDMTNDIEEKCVALWDLMYIFDETREWQQLAEVIKEYDKLNTEIFAESIKNYRDALYKATGEYIEHEVDYPERERTFPKIFRFKGVKFTRIDDDEAIDSEHKFEIDAITGDYAPAIGALFKKYLGNENVKLAVAMDWTYNLEEYYEKLNDVPLPSGVSKFPFGSDILIVDVLLNYNIKAISTHSIFTEYTHVFNLNDFKERDEESGSFDIDSDKVEIYLVDYTNATDSVIKHSGVIKYVDEDIEKF